MYFQKKTKMQNQNTKIKLTNKRLKKSTNKQIKQYNYFTII